ncbi:DUF2256 domain-containing protein [Azotobacter chroococcum]|nr:DUF2256 domain-containing protein [Azotobacter chroococcum]TBV99475.1 DUF2256 domain-containing protein [Azotobacter chroococcum]
MNKAELPLAWRRKWARCRDEVQVRYCSERCRRRRTVLAR